MKTYFDNDNKFAELFNENTGFYIRTGVLDEDKKDTGIDPFMRNYPSLLDVGIMGHCKNAHLCTVGCYQGKIIHPNMSFENFKSIIDQSKGKTFEVALGGFGSPNEHPDFINIIRYAKENGVVPNYTTSGIELTAEQEIATKEYCGAVAVSWYRQRYTYSALDAFIRCGCKTNIHYVLGNDSIDEAIIRLETDNFFDGINAVIFLMYKPVGCVKANNVLQYNDPRVARFYELVDQQHPFKVGLDACNMPAVSNFSKNINPISTTPCDGGSFSGYITPDMFMLPCSFDSVTRNYAVDLNTHTIEQAWNSLQFNDFRNYHKNSCPNCPVQANCRGGCPIAQEINDLCTRPEKELA